ncbi:M56 family metallopeptidase [Zhouia amylolytica]|uniref:M56 family metallopeptidase n=1 Tax=Zhouia amylolytica TaxID=376730 RepID=UPI0020CF3695|nr:M56 family metallopeptidase [Zhouia amylolytica]MCQ0110264.1 energy transducer TonB [Zhouia amylolytica]
MLHYIIQTIAFQLLFLLVYDVLLKKETFFNWNRAYLIITPLLSLALPFIQLDSFKEVVPQAYAMQLPVIVLAETTVTESQAAQASLLPDLFWWQWLLLAGSLLSVLWFGYKLYKIYQLKRQGKIHWYQEYTEVLLTKSEVAFSFFKHIFLGDSIKEKNHQHIIEHELVHIKEKHTWDLMLFELLRIVFWFNPLIYIYQARVSELHEFIADAHTAKKSKKQSYELLLEQVFNTEHISFINQFFNHSLIKKRIVMLQKTRSRKVWQLKYLLMVPLVLGMLIYTSCEKEVTTEEPVVDSEAALEEQLRLLEAKIKEDPEAFTPEMKQRLMSTLGNDAKNDVNKESNELTVVAFSLNPNQEKSKDINYGLEVVPSPPSFNIGDYNEGGTKTFTDGLNRFIKRNFRYPEFAAENLIEGRVMASFKIEKDGRITIEGISGVHQSLEDEVERMLLKMPILNPGKDETGNPVPVIINYPVVFKLN